MPLELITEERLFLAASLVPLLLFRDGLFDLSALLRPFESAYVMLHLSLVAFVFFGVDWHSKDPLFRRHRTQHHGVVLGLLVVPTLLLALLLSCPPNPYSSQLSPEALATAFLYLSAFLISTFEALNASHIEPLKGNELLNLGLTLFLALILESFLHVSLILPYTTVFAPMGFLHVALLTAPIILYFSFKMTFRGLGLSASFSYGEQLVVATGLALVAFRALYALNHEQRRMSSGISVFLGLTTTIVLSGLALNLISSLLRTLSDRAATLLYLVLVALTGFFGFVTLPQLCDYPSVITIILNDLSEGNTLLLTLYWLGVMASSFSFLGYLRSTSSQFPSRTTVRKFFHLMALLIFLPGFALEPEWMRLCFECALAVFVLIECFRFVQRLRSNPLSKFLNDFIASVTDENDAGPIVLTHIYLLLGCATPLLFFSDRSFLFISSGTLLLGIGDSFASVIGSRIGRIRWTSHSKKSVEGTLAAYLSLRLSLYLATLLGFISNSELAWGVETAVALICLFEGVLTQIDNLFLPLLLALLFLLI